MMTPRARAFGLAVLGLGAGVLLAEAGLRVADDGAFPHLNVYEADAALGTRLRPGATQRVAFGGNPATDVRINTQGFRGADWGAPAPGEIVVVGDSQAFGLGVEEDEALPARLAAATGRPVLNAGVPTYGPAEYLAVIDRLLAERKPATVVLVVNLANDLFERDRPNKDRHKVWDGWAVRAETMPEAVWGFPGRAWLFRDSHLVFALRRALYTHHDEADLGVPSEGGLADLLVAPPAVAASPPPEADDPPVQAAILPASRGDTVAARVAEAAEERRSLEDSLLWSLRQVEPSWSYEELVTVDALRRQNRPGDIVYEREAEGARGVTVTAELLKRAAEMKKSAVPTLRAWLAAHPADPRADAIRRQLAAWDAAGATIDGLAQSTDAVRQADSPLAPWLREVKARCTAGGAELVVAALPLDVQVSPAEWEKYGKPAQDMSATHSLLTELVGSARRMGVRALDLREPLAAAEPGAFLHADLHMSAKGTTAAAAAIAAELARPAPVATPGAGFPDGRSRMPTVAEMALAPEVVVRGSSRNRCSTRRAREWLVVECEALQTERGPAFPPAIALADAPLESAWSVNGTDTVLLVPLIPGREVRVHYEWSAQPGATDDDTAPWAAGRREALVVRWEGPTARIAFEPLADGPAVVTAARSPCLVSTWQDTWWQPDRGCARTYADQCHELLGCATGLGTVPATCLEGEASVGSTGWCFALCDAAHPCAEGVCTDWQGAGVCL